MPYTTGLSANTAAALTALERNEEVFVAMARALYATMIRESGAAQTGNTYWVNQQDNACLNYMGQLAALCATLATMCADKTQIGASFAGSCQDRKGARNALKLLAQNIAAKKSKRFGRKCIQTVCLVTACSWIITATGHPCIRRGSFRFAGILPRLPA